MGKKSGVNCRPFRIIFRTTVTTELESVREGPTITI